MNKNTVDLTHALNNDITVFPGAPSPVFDVAATIEQHGYAETRINMLTHMGTHIDAPCHILKNTKTLDQFGVQKFMGKAVVIDCRLEKQIGLRQLNVHGAIIAEVDFILFHTGWQEKWKTPAYFEGYPVLTDEAANWLAEFPLKGLGFDAISPDPVDSHDLPNHHILLAKEILIIENLTCLDALPEGVFNFYCLPLKLEKADGGPVRAVAWQ